MRGNYRPSRHGPRPAEVEAAAADDPWKTTLRLPGAPQPSRPLDPIEELLHRDGIEILPEDRQPKR